MATPKPSARIREQAAVICSAMACNPRDSLKWHEAAESIGACEDAYLLASRAFSHADWYVLITWPDYDPVYAEAEALIRTGWSPGDEE